MIILDKNSLQFRFPDVKQSAGCEISFKRTLRIPDDNKSYSLPPALGDFPLHHVDDYSALPEIYQKRGGVFFPMFQSEAMWINFNGTYPCAVKIAAGKINAVSGKSWSEGLTSHNKIILSPISNHGWMGLMFQKDDPTICSNAFR